MNINNKSSWTGLTFFLIGISLMFFIASLTPFNSNVVTAWLLETAYMIFFVLGLCVLVFRLALAYLDKDR